MSEAEYQASLGGPEPWDDDDELYDRAMRPLEDRTARGLWTTGAGDVLEIAGMTDEHLENAIAYAERNGFDDTDKIDELRAELATRGS